MAGKSFEYQWFAGKSTISISSVRWLSEKSLETFMSFGDFPLPPWLPEGAMVSQGQQIDVWIWLNRSYILIYTYLYHVYLCKYEEKPTLVVNLTCDACVCVFVHLCLQAIATYIPLRIQFWEVHVWGTYQVVQAKSSNTVPDHGNTVPGHGDYTNPAHA